jgi:hypothetical protein
MDLRSLNRGELIAIFGGAVLAVSVFLAWYTLDNRFAHLNGCHGPSSSCTGWESLSVLRFALLAAAVAPTILAWIIARGHTLAWPRGEVTAIVAVTALILTLFRGVIDKPGSPHEEIGIDYGWWVAIAGGLLILAGSVWRAQESAPRRKPPGVL